MNVANPGRAWRAAALSLARWVQIIDGTRPDAVPQFAFLDAAPPKGSRRDANAYSGERTGGTSNAARWELPEQLGARGCEPPAGGCVERWNALD